MCKSLAAFRFYMINLHQCHNKCNMCNLSHHSFVPQTARGSDIKMTWLFCLLERLSVESASSIRGMQVLHKRCSDRCTLAQGLVGRVASWFGPTNSNGAGASARGRSRSSVNGAAAAPDFLSQSEDPDKRRLTQAQAKPRGASRQQQQAMVVCTAVHHIDLCSC